MSVLDKSSAAVSEIGLSAVPERSVSEYRYNFDGSGGPGPKYLRTEELIGRTGDNLTNRVLVRFAERLLGIDTVNDVCVRAGTPWPSSYEMIEHLFRELNIKWRVTNPEVIAGLPDSPAIFVANHPYGMADAFAVNNMLEKHRPNFRLFANKFLTTADSITHKLLFVDPLMGEQNRAMNRRSVTTAIRHLKSGGDLALFPGRYCSHITWNNRRAQDIGWSDQIKTFVEAGNATLVPMYISGENSRWFQYAGLVHPKLRTLRILREFLRGNREFTVTIGDPLPAEELLNVAGFASPGNFARSLTYFIKRQFEEPRHLAIESNVAVAKPALIAAPGSLSDRMAATLDSSQLLTEKKGFQVFASDYKAAANIMDELAQVRFDAFENELPVKSPDDMVDAYDEYNSHLLLWDSSEKRLAGAYRYFMPGQADLQLSHEKLISSMIFSLGPEVRRLLPQSIELGRVAISPDYQKSYFPLMLLWRGILSLVARHPEIRLIFGPIAFSTNFSPLSLEVIRRWLMINGGDERWSPYLHPLVVPDLNIPSEIDVGDLISTCKSYHELNALVTAIERGRRPLPVLLRHYAGVGTKFPAFGTWPQFDHALTTLVMLDVHDLRPAFLQRYLGKEDAHKVLADRGLATQ